MEAVRRSKLRVGVFADGARQPRWLVESLARVAASEHAEIALVSIAPGSSRARATALWRAYSGLDRRLFGSQVDWSREGDVECLVPRERRVALAGDTDLAAWRSRLRDARLDVAFVLGDVDEAPLEGLARYGTWRHAFGESQGACEPLAARREVVDGANVVPSGIRIRRPGAPDRLACASWSRTFPFSVARSRDALFSKGADFASRALRDLHAFGPRWLDEGTALACALPRERFPGTVETVRDITVMAGRVAQRAAQKVLKIDQWSIGWRFGGEDVWDGSLEGFFRLEPPKDRFWADPFPVSVGGRHYIFFEELPFATGRAHISVVEVDARGRASAPVVVLQRDYHLSYPFLLEEDGVLYMIPETAENHTVEVYRCVEFPHKWRLERVLLRGMRCADATVHRADGLWWMFANAALPGAEINDELHLFSAPSLMGEWTPHRRNPIKSDVRGARPAGGLFTRGGVLYRPGQICAPLYGSGIALHRVTRLDADEYTEEEHARIVPAERAPRPQWGGCDVLGIHTWNRTGDFAVTDAFVRRPRFSGAVR